MPIQPVSGEIKAQPLNDNFSYLDSEISSVNMGPGGYFETVSQLNTAYPAGSDRFFIVGEYAYFWKNNSWVQGQVFQASVIPENGIWYKNLTDPVSEDILLGTGEERNVAFPSNFNATGLQDEYATWILPTAVQKTVRITKVKIKVREAGNKFSLVVARTLSDATIQIYDSKVYTVPNAGTNTVNVDFYVPAGYQFGFSAQSFYATGGNINWLTADRNGIQEGNGSFSYITQTRKFQFAMELIGYEIEPTMDLKNQLLNLSSDVYVESGQIYDFPYDGTASIDFWIERKFAYSEPIRKKSIIKSFKAKGYEDGGIATISVCNKVSETEFEIKRVYPFTVNLAEQTFLTNIIIEEGDYIALGGNLKYVGKTGFAGSYTITEKGNSVEIGTFTASFGASTIFSSGKLDIVEIVDPKETVERITALEIAVGTGTQMAYINRLPKRLICFGDSITFGYKSTDPETMSYPARIAQNTDIEVTKNAVSGSQWTAQGSAWDIANAFETRCQNVDFSQFDAAIFWGGTNDWQYGATVEGVKNAMANVFEKAFADNPSIKIIVLSPIYRNHSFKGDSDLNTNDNGLYLLEFCEAIKEKCIEYKVPFVDLYHESGINKLNYNFYFADGLHPNDDGYEYLANLIIKKLNYFYGGIEVI